jgi:hypothetical protein
MTKLLAALLIAVSLPAAAELNCQEKSALALFVAIPHDAKAYNSETFLQRAQRKEAYNRLSDRDILENGGKFIYRILPLISSVSEQGTVSIDSGMFAANVLNICKRGDV